MIELELCKAGLKVTNNSMPNPIMQLFKISGGGVKTHRYPTRNKRTPNIIKHKSTLVNTSFLCKSIATFSKLRYKLKSTNSLKNFARNLKRYFLSNSSN